MKKAIIATAVLVLSMSAPGARSQQTAPPAVSPAPAALTQTQKNIEAYLRNVYALGPDVTVTVGGLKDSAVEGIQETTIDVLIEGNKESVKFFVSKDGKFLFRGDMSDMGKDPQAEIRAKIDIKDAPVFGEAKAPITLVEYSDFECPVCKSLHDVLRAMLPNYAGKVRVVFKDFPIEQIHPWARTAALAGRCAYQQDPKTFWKMYDLIYDNQEVISAANAWTKMADYAVGSGLNAETLKSCMASPGAGDALTASRDNGLLVEVNATPTVFVNGRRMVGADQRLLEQYIKYELAHQKTAKTQ